MLLILSVAAFATATSPRDTIAALDKKWSEAFNAHKYDAVAALYHPSAILIPPTADAFIAQKDIAAFAADAFKHGMTNVSLVPSIVHAESDNLYHEIGALSVAGGPASPYYVRWANVDNKWYLAVDITAIGGAEGQTSDKVDTSTGDTPINIIAAMDSKFQKLYNAQDFAGVASLYNPGADLIPPTCDTFLNNRTSITGFFKASYEHGLKTIHSMVPTKVHVENSALWHEIGFIKHSLGQGPYYVRWINPTGSMWQIAFDIMSIGENPK